MKDCCSSEESNLAKEQKTIHHHESHERHDDDHNHGDDHDHGSSSSEKFQHIALLTALAILVIEMVMIHAYDYQFKSWVFVLINVIAYLLAGWSVLRLAFRKLFRGDIFNEFVLMTVATLGAFAIAEFTEAVAVMVFYSIGEWFQDSAVNRAKANIKALLDARPDEVLVKRNGTTVLVPARAVNIGELIIVKAGEKVGLDGRLVTDTAVFNTAALTGESMPVTKYKDDAILAGMINLNKVVEIEVTAKFQDSKLSRILSLVQDAAAQKSKTQLFISRFAKIYTPIVFFLALAVIVVPYFLVPQYNFHQWLYRALVFLVISCPCALVVSIPLGYFGGIGLASRKGILFKGGNFLDVMAKIDTVVFDKTGTLTKGVFKIVDVVTQQFDKTELIRLAVLIEKHSSHPLAQAVINYAEADGIKGEAVNVEEISGHGLRGLVDGKVLLAGNLKLLSQFDISYAESLKDIIETTIVLAYDGKYIGYLSIADEVKSEAADVIRDIHELGISTVMLSGDKQTVANQVGQTLHIKQVEGGLLPEDKVNALKRLKAEGRTVAFVGDGINDTPVLAAADIGLAMGGLGSDAAIETADVVIQNDHLTKIITAISVGKLTQRIVWQNIILAMGVKLLVLILGTFGLASLWDAVIADVGVALLAILNAVRLQKMKLF